MPTPTKSLTRTLTLTGLTKAAQTTAINDEKATQEASGFVCVSVNRGSKQDADGRIVEYADLEFRAESTLVPGSAVRTIKKVVGHADLTAAATTETIDFSSQIPAGATVLARFIKVDTLFSGGSVSACTVDFGDADAATGWFNGENIFTGQATGVRAKPGTLGAIVSGAAADVKLAARTPKLKFNTTGDNVVNLSAGSLTAYVQYIENSLGAPVP